MSPHTARARVIWLIAGALLLVLAFVFWRSAEDAGGAAAETDASAAALSPTLAGSLEQAVPPASEPVAAHSEVAKSVANASTISAPGTGDSSARAAGASVASGLSSAPAIQDRTTGEPETERFPRYWRRCSTMAGNSSASYRIASDSTNAWNGSSSALIASREAQRNPGGASICQAISAAAFKGKRVSFSAYLRTVNAVPGAHLTFRADAADGRVVALSQIVHRWSPGTTAWTPHSIVIDVPDSADVVVVGAALMNTGSVWVDDVAIEVVDDDRPVNQPAPPVTRYAVRIDPSSVSKQLMNAGFEETVPVAADRR